MCVVVDQESHEQIGEQYEDAGVRKKNPSSSGKCFEALDTTTTLGHSGQSMKIVPGEVVVLFRTTEADVRNLPRLKHLVEELVADLRP